MNTPSSPLPSQPFPPSPPPPPPTPPLPPKPPAPPVPLTSPLAPRTAPITPPAPTPAAPLTSSSTPVDARPIVVPAAAAPPALPPPRRPWLIIFWWLVTILLIALIAAMGTLMAAYVSGWRPPINVPFLSRELPPAEVLSRMYAAANELTSFSYALETAIKTEPSDGSPTTPAVASQSEALQRDQKRLKDASDLLGQLSDYQTRNRRYPLSLIDAVSSADQARIAAALAEGSYGYRQEQEGAGFILNIALETDEAMQAYTKALAARPERNSKITNGRIVSLHERSLNETGEGWAADAAVAQLTAAGSLYRYIPAEFDAKVTLGGKAALSAERNDSQFNLSGTLALGDASFAFGGETLTVGNNLFLKITQAPSLGIWDFGALKNKWIKYDAASLARDLGVNGSNSQSLYVVERIKLALELANEENVITVAESLPRERTADGKRPYRFRLALNADAMPRFIERYNSESQQFNKNKSMPTKIDAAALKAFTERTAFEVLIDEKTFQPLRLTATSRQVPPASVTKLSGKQIYTQMVLVLSNINEPVVIEAPVEFITSDQATKLLQGE